VPSKSALPTEPLQRLHALLVQRLRQLGSRTRAFPVALVVASERSRTTWHVQRDLEHAAELLEEDALDADTPFGAYLSGRAPQGQGMVCLGRWPAAPLTESQRLALEHALGSRLAAVQGPPGTGKTTVILNLVAHQLIEKARAFVNSGVMSEEFVLVTSTNNRAVDNVVEALSIEPFTELPLCLRLGHRALTEKVSTRVLQRAHAWLSQQPEHVPEEELAAAKRAFSEALVQVDAALGPAREAYERSAQLSQWLASRAELERQGSLEARQQGAQQVAVRVAELLAHGARPVAGERAASEPAASAASSTVASSAVAETAPWRSAPKAAEMACAGVLRAFDKLAELCDAVGPAALKRLGVQYERLQTRELAALESALGVTLPRLSAPGSAPGSASGSAPKSEVGFEDWEDFVAAAVTPFNALVQALTQLVASERAAEQLRALELRLAEPAKGPDAGSASEGAGEAGVGEAGFELLFQRAIELRSVWLRQHRAALLNSLEQAIVQCKNLCSLRTMLSSTKAAGSWLRQLFPSIGSTLLSLGNTLDSDLRSCRRVVIDEAGQCPSAYAVSALLRAQSALLIGDVHQLEPVVGLSREDEQRIVRGLALSLPPQRLGPYRMFDESGNSAQGLADRAVRERPTLRDHFRCQPAIIAMPEAWCGYGMSVRTPPRSRGEQAPRLSSAALFQDCAGEQQRFAGSWVNPSEIDQVVAWLTYLLQQGIPPGDIGVITPFRSQSEALVRRLGAERLPLARGLEDEEASDNLELFGSRAVRTGGVAVGTVHRFQGGERSIILFSSTLTRAANLRFVDERVNLLNVAVSRAREHLLVIGHGETLQAGRNTRLLVSGAQHISGF
jgi:RecA/RadA recombinase